MSTVLSTAATLTCAHGFSITPTTSSALTIGGSPVAVGGSLSVACTIADSSSTKHDTSISAAGGTAAAHTAGATPVLLSSVTLTGDGTPPTCAVAAEAPAPLTAS